MLYRLRWRVFVTPRDGRERYHFNVDYLSTDPNAQGAAHEFTEAEVDRRVAAGQIFWNTVRTNALGWSMDDDVFLAGWSTEPVLEGDDDERP